MFKIICKIFVTLICIDSHMIIHVTSVNSVHNAHARSFFARAPPPLSVLATLTRAGPPSPRASPGSPFPHPQNTSHGTGSDWKNLPGTAHTNTVALIYKINHVKTFCHISVHWLTYDNSCYKSCEIFLSH
jgi:hypothetical protein